MLLTISGATWEHLEDSDVCFYSAGSAAAGSSIPRKENFNGETWGQSGICLYFHRCSTDSIVCEALPRGNRTLRVCGHEYQPALLAGGASGVFGRGQSARSKR